MPNAPEPYPCRRCGTPTTNITFACDTCQRVCGSYQSFQRRTQLQAGRFRPAHYCLRTGLPVDDDQAACYLFERTPPAFLPGRGSRQRPPGGLSYIQLRYRRAQSWY